MKNSKSLTSAEQIPMRSASDSTEMSTPSTIIGIFTEPTRVFSNLRERPRFLAALILSIAAFMLFNITYFERMGFETVIRAQTEANPRASTVSPEQKERAIAIQLTPAFKAVRLLAPIVIFTLVALAGGALYLLGSAIFGGQLNYKQALAVWTYATLPPAVLLMICNFAMLFISPPDTDLAIARGARRGLVQSNPGFLVNSASSPMLATMLGGLDALTIFGLILATIGLRKVGRMSASAAWGTSLSIWGVGLLFKIGYAAFTGSQM